MRPKVTQEPSWGAAKGQTTPTVVRGLGCALLCLSVCLSGQTDRQTKSDHAAAPGLRAGSR
eukprot:scaffold69570_cov59-Phaeocystis_antarctica.AAC.3